MSLDQILVDSQLAPDVFLWNGPVDVQGLRRWIEQRGYRVPDDLIEFWAISGGDFFDSETIFAPGAEPPTDDNIDDMNTWMHGHGLPARYLIFHHGAFLSAIRQMDCVIVELDRRTYRELQTFSSLNDWYVRLPRDGFASAYYLPHGCSVS